jgi:hypothetical protein
MRVIASMILAIAAISGTAAPLRAQTYDPSYPVCLQTFDEGGGYIECGYTSLAQCNATASSRGAQCVINPYSANAKAETQSTKRGHRRAY